MVAPIIARAAVMAAAKLLAKKGAKKVIGGGKVKSATPMKTRPTGTKNIKGGVVTKQRPKPDRPITSRATSTATRQKSDSLDKVINQIERGNLQPRKVPRGQRQVTEKHMENKLNYRFRYGKDRWK